MILSLDNAAELNATSMKKLEKLVSKGNTMLLNHATWCGHCNTFKPEWDKLTTGAKRNVNFVKIENQVLQRLKDENPKLYKRVTPKDGMIYFPMIVVFVTKQADKPSQKKIYEGDRSSAALSEYLSTNVKDKKVTKKSKTPKVAKAPKAVKAVKAVPIKHLQPAIEKPTMSLTSMSGYKSLYDLNRELDALINQMSQIS